MAGKILRSYTRAFEQRPYVTLMVVNAALMSLGDVTAQTLTAFTSEGGAPFAYDASRTLRFGFFGASWGPLAGAWNKLLSVSFPLRPKGSAPTSINMGRTKMDATNPLPGLKIPTGAKLERGGSTPPIPRAGRGNEASAGGGAEAGPGAGVSLLAVFKRVAADQLLMAPFAIFMFLFSISILEGADYEAITTKLATDYFPILFANWTIWPLFQAINFRYVPLRFRVPVGSLVGIAWTCFLSLRTAASASKGASAEAVKI